MQEVQMGSHTIQSHGAKVARIHMHDWLILILLIVIDVILNLVEPFHRFVGEEMMVDLKYPMKDNTIPFWTVPVFAILFPFSAILVNYYYRRNVYDLHHATLGLLYSVLLTGVITDAIKDAVGRPRPDFFWRCFPDGVAKFDAQTKNVICHGDEGVIKEGHKSFPSGHTSWSFAGLTFLSWYLSGKIRVFDRKGHIAKLGIVLLPLLLGALVAASRVDDYWHHWQDVLVGGLIGMTIATLCYLLSYPFPHVKDGWAPYAYFQVLGERNHVQSSSSRISSLRLRQPDIETVYMQPGRSKEGIGSDSHSASPDLDAMENGRRL